MPQAAGRPTKGHRECSTIRPCWLFGESATLRGAGLDTSEVASTALFLLSPRSSGVNAQGIVVDAGMGVNYFDRDLVQRATRPDEEPPR